MKILFYFFLACTYLSIAQSPAVPCYAKFSAIDSVSGKSVSQISISNPTTLLFKDTYKCNCTAITLRVTLVRERRPLMVVTIGGKLSVSTLLQLLNTQTLKEGDRLMLEVVNSVEPSGAACKSVSNSTVILLNVIQ
jgi:hypothetical protein